MKTMRTMKAMRTMKGQSTAEYITTYGWALFALVVVITIILGSGMLTPNFLISERCELGTNLQCRAAVYNTDDQTKISLELLNGFAYRIRIVSVEVFRSDGTTSFNGLSREVTIESGDKETFIGSFSEGQLPSNELEQFTVRVKYASCAPELGPGCGDNHTITGRIIARVIPSG
ncbi:MAG: hypothetical protein QXT05_00660 [Candidatus Bilamarchaeaceae archaeon]